MAAEKDDRSYMTLVTIQVENTLFRVPREPLESQSKIFRDMFSLPVAGDAEGSSDKNPIRLEGITKSKFKRFLEVLFTGACEETAQPCQVFDTWFPVAELAHMWEFEAIHKRAVENMLYDQICKPPAEKVEFAVYHDIRPWLLPALNELAQRKEPLGSDDLAILGAELALKVAAVRESLTITSVYYDSRSHPSKKLTTGSRDAGRVDFTPTIKRVYQI